ncbi:MAG: hypothetical protein WBE52_00940, partial [Terriglobales bacterium]
EKDDDSVMEFPTLAAMQGQLEAIDVENGEYEAWDSLGHRLELSAGKPKSEWLKIVLTEVRLPEMEFDALRSRAKKWTEYESLSKRLLRWFGRV